MKNHFKILNLKTLNISFLFLSFFITPNLHAFSDLGNHPYSRSITYAENQGIVKGYSDGTFRPNNIINRAEFTKIIIQARFSQTEINKCDIAELNFPDVGFQDWFAPYICVAKKNNIINGYPDGFFRPSWPILFTESAKIISQSFEYKLGQSEIWYEPFILALESRVAIPQSISNLEHKVSRAEMTEMIYRLKENIRTSTSKTFQAVAGHKHSVIYKDQIKNQKSKQTILDKIADTKTETPKVSTRPIKKKNNSNDSDKNSENKSEEKNGLNIVFDKCGDFDDFLGYKWISNIQELESNDYEISQICYSEKRDMAIILGSVSPSLLSLGSFDDIVKIVLWQYFPGTNTLNETKTKYSLISLEASDLSFGPRKGLLLTIFDRASGSEYRYNYITKVMQRVTLCGNLDSDKFDNFDWITDVRSLNKSFTPPYEDVLRVDWPEKNNFSIESICYFKDQDIVLGAGVRALENPPELTELKKPKGARGHLTLFQFQPKTSLFTKNITGFEVDGFASYLEFGSRGFKNNTIKLYERKGANPNRYLSSEYKYQYGLEEIQKEKYCQLTKTQLQHGLNYDANFGEGLKCVDRSEIEAENKAAKAEEKRLKDLGW